MIKPNELRIGNWLYGYDPLSDFAGAKINFQVCNIEEERINVYRVEGFGDESAYEYDGVKVTPEILAMCGFEFLKFDKDVSYHDFFKLGSFELMIAHEGVEFEYEQNVFYWYDETHPIQELHKLQNLYFALYKKELRIVLPIH